MSGWQALIWAGTCGFGAIAFLKGVANDIERVEGKLRRLEHAQRETLKKAEQTASQDLAAPPAVAEAA